MSEDHDNPFKTDGSDRDALFGQVAKKMLAGAGIGAAIILAPVIYVYALYLIGTLLPPESKEAADPTPDSFSALEAPADPTRIVWAA